MNNNTIKKEILKKVYIKDQEQLGTCVNRIL